MKTGINKHINRKNLLFVCSMLKDIEYCVCYGTALGLYREKDIIEGDDDVDFLVNKVDYEKVLSLMEKNGYKKTKYQHPEVFSQFYKNIEKTRTLVDFYFYEDTHFDYVIEKWNVFGKPEDASLHAHIPKDIIFPILKETYFETQIKIPNNLEKMCKFIYGDKFMQPLQKQKEYFQIMKDNKIEVTYDKKNG